MSTIQQDFLRALVAGGMAGTITDLVLFPLDTLKTRLQSTQGLLKAGGFRGLYSGLGPVLLGAAPEASLFFVTYELMKRQGYLANLTPPPVVHMVAASSAEVTTCILRVPVEVIKQRAQAFPGMSSMSIFKSTLSSEGFMGLYRGFWSTVCREIPFSIIQFPIWEFAKESWSEFQGSLINSWQSAICGAFSGAAAASLTTPLDVAKTRIMLSEKGSKTARGYVFPTLVEIWSERGISGLFAGMVPRVMWISVGGFVFLGSYEKGRQMLNSMGIS